MPAKESKSLAGICAVTLNLLQGLYSKKDAEINSA